MIAIDTSALMAILQREPDAERCIVAIERADVLRMSAATVAEALVVSSRRGIGNDMGAFIDSLAVEVISVTAATARRIRLIYERWGKGVHPAGLNFADCFAYDVASENRCPLLYVGRDFARTDIPAA